MTRPTLEDRIENIHQRFLAKNGGAKASDPTEPTPMILTISQIQAYDHNPRRERNAAHDRIKDSIRRRGFVGVLPITRRPGDTHYIVAEGGNTVLHILKDLFEETQDPRYARIQCLFEPWVKEGRTIAQSRAWFRRCLAQHDNEEWLLEPIEHAVIDRLAAICGEDRYQVIADLDPGARLSRSVVGQ
jgi:hypothetical protein